MKTPLTKAVVSYHTCIMNTYCFLNTVYIYIDKLMDHKLSQLNPPITSFNCIYHFCHNNLYSKRNQRNRKFDKNRNLIKTEI